MLQLIKLLQYIYNVNYKYNKSLEMCVTVMHMLLFQVLLYTHVLKQVTTSLYHAMYSRSTVLKSQADLTINWAVKLV